MYFKLNNGHEVSFSLGQLVYIDEKATGIRYYGLESKGKRPYILINYGKKVKFEDNKCCRFYMFIPCISTVDKSGKTRTKAKEWLEVNFRGKNSYLIPSIPMFVSRNKMHKLLNMNSLESHKKIIVLNEKKLKQIIGK